MAVLTVLQNTVLALHGATGISGVTFTNTTAHPTATLTFLAADLDNVHFASALAVVGNAEGNRFVLNGAHSLSLAGWTFTG